MNDNTVYLKRFLFNENLLTGAFHFGIRTYPEKQKLYVLNSDINIETCYTLSDQIGYNTN